MLDFVNKMKTKEMKPIVDFLNFCEINNADDLEKVSTLAEALSRRVEKGEENIIPAVDYMLHKIELFEDAELIRLGVEQPDDVTIVQHLIEMHGLSITALAKEIGIQRSVLSEILGRKNNRRFTRDQLDSLADYFNVNISVFFQ